MRGFNIGKVDMNVFSRHLRVTWEWLWVKEGDGRWLVLILALALALRVSWALVMSPPPTPGWDATNYEGLALRLANGEGYVQADGTPTAFWPVGYPAFLAGIYIVFGQSWMAAYMVNSILGAVSVLLTYRLAREFLESSLPLVAAGIMAVFPSHIAFATVLGTETLYTVFTLFILLGALILARRPTWKNAVILGFVIGLSVYVRATLLLFPVCVSLLILLKGGNLRTSVGLGCVVGLAVLLTILPWTVRNFIVMGGPVLTSTNGGTVFYIGNGPYAIGSHANFPTGAFSALDELTMYREGYKLGLEHIVNNPIEWAKVLPRKFFHLWASDWAGIVAVQDKCQVKWPA